LDRSAGAIEAAVRAGTEAGFDSMQPIVLQDSNNVVVWLSPHPVVAKVGIWEHSAEALGREVSVCQELGQCGAPTARPIGVLRHCGAARLPVSLWGRIEAVEGRTASALELAHSLEQVHASLRHCVTELPSYRAGIDHARATLYNDQRMTAPSANDLTFLRGSFDRWTSEVYAVRRAEQPLHGEPHSGNFITSGAGPVFVDFEGVCTGPLEWDLASVEPAVADHFAWRSFETRRRTLDGNRMGRGKS
jgi:aminoglycoside phosphotransferase (APT) family kinase protein